MSRRTLGFGAAQLITGHAADDDLRRHAAIRRRARRAQLRDRRRRSTCSTTTRPTGSRGSTATTASWHRASRRSSRPPTRRRSSPRSTTWPATTSRETRGTARGRRLAVRRDRASSSFPRCIVGRDADGRVWRTVIDDVERADPIAHVASSTHRAVGVRVVDHDHVATEWRAMVDHALVDIDRGALEKVVLARAVHIDADRPVRRSPPCSRYLRRSQPGCIVYADRGFVGASPELLVRKVGAHVTSRPLAGTGVDTAALVRSAKDAHEHQLVVDAVVARAAPALLRRARRRSGAARARRREPSRHDDHRARRRRRRRRSPTSSPRCIPTPAVAGTPRPVALDAIDALEAVAARSLRGPVRLDRPQRRRRVRRRAARRRDRRHARGDPRRRRHRLRFRSRRGVDRDAAEAHADAASLGSAVTARVDRRLVEIAREHVVGPEHDHDRRSTTSAATGSTFCRNRCPTEPIVVADSDGYCSPSSTNDE